MRSIAVSHVRHRHRFRHIVPVALLALGLAGVFALHGMASARVKEVTYRTEGGMWLPGTLPLRLQNAAAGTIEVRFTVSAGLLHPVKFSLQPDDCLERLTLDGMDLREITLPYCDFARPMTFVFRSLRPGKHVMQATVKNAGGDALFSLTPLASDASVALPRVAALVWLVSVFAWVLRRKRAAPWVWQSALLLLFGTVIRAVYTANTPHWTRGHDTDGHIEYVRYLADNLSLPPPDGGWEFWQPPLYYLSQLPLFLIDRAAGLGEEAAIAHMQGMSLLLSVVTLAVALWIGLRVVEHRQLLPLWLAPFCFLPSLVFLAPRINNDVLVVPLTLLAIALLIEWQKRPRLWVWGLSACVTGLAILTKNTSLLLLPVACGFAVLRPWKKFWHPATHLALFFTIVLLVAGWFSAYRMLANTEQKFLIGNSGTLNSGLRVEDGPLTYVTFNPIAVVGRPFNNAWSDEARRKNFLEYLYRSAFFGEFDLGADRILLASWIMLSSLIALAVCLWGGVRAWKIRPKREVLAMLGLTAVLLAGHALFRMRYPFSSSQDFRYSLPVLIPVAYFLVAGFASLKSETARKIVESSLVLCCGLSAMLLLSL